MSEPRDPAVRARHPRLGPFPLWLVGLAILVGACMAAFVLQDDLGERSVIVQSLVALQGIFLLIAGAGRRYLTWSVLVLVCIVSVSSILISGLLCFEWRRTVRDLGVEPDQLAQRLDAIDRIRIAYENSNDPAEQEALKIAVPEYKERAKGESVATIERLEAEAGDRLASFTLSLVIAAVFVASIYGYYHLYLRARKEPHR